MPALNRASRPAFTLVEMLLVIAVITIATLIVTPSLKNAVRGSRLKSAARIVISSGRYARSMAVLQQTPMNVTYALGQSSVSIIPAHLPASGTGTPSPSSEMASSESLEPASSNAPSMGASGTESLTRSFERVKIIEVITEDSSDSTVITYGTNGRCPEHTVKLQDEYGATILIHIDALATATTEAIQ